MAKLHPLSRALWEQGAQAALAHDTVRKNALRIAKKVLAIGDSFAWKQANDARRMVYEDCQNLVRSAGPCEHEGIPLTSEQRENISRDVANGGYMS